MQKKVIYRKQLQNNSCGHAVLQMVIECLTNCYVDQAKLIRALQPSETGISLYDIRQLANDYNIETETYITKDTENLLKIPLKKGPLLLVVKNEELTHFILVEKKRFGKYFIHDPAHEKPIWISVEKLKSIWLGIFMSFTFLGLSLKKGKEGKTINSYFPHIDNINKSVYFIAFSISLISGFGAIISGFFFRTLISNTNSQSSISVVAIISSFFLTLMLLQKIIDAINCDISSKYQIKNNQLISKAFLSSLHKLRNPNQDRIKLLKTIQQVQSYFVWKNKSKITLPFYFFTVLAYLIAMGLIAWEFLLATAILAILMILYFTYVSRKYSINNSLQKETTLKATFQISLLLEDLERTIYGQMNRRIVQSLNESNQKSIANEINNSSHLNQLLIFSTIAFSVSTTVIYTISIFKIYNFSLKLEDVIPALLIIANFWITFLSLLQNISFKINRKEIKEIIKNMADLFHKDVVFMPRINTFITKIRKLEFKAGQCYCIIGKNGSGKTTFVKDIAKGRIIFINGKHTNSEHNLNSIFLSSTATFYLSTIKENILYTNYSSCRIFKDNWGKFKLNKYMDSLGMKMNDIIFPGAANLSSGQQQVVNLLRIFARNDEICLIDEALNAIDNKLKYMLFNDIKQYFKNKILIVISHDMKIIKNTDVIINFD